MKFRKTLVLFIAITTSAAKAQFRDATIPQVPVNLTPVFAANTGNDRLDYSSNTYEVSVWDDSGNNAGLAWKVGSSVGFTLISPGAGVKDPDVVLVENDAGMVFALTCYYAQNLSEFRFELFQWMFGAQAFNSIGVYTLSPGPFEKTINIDASDEGDFVIVWDEPGMVIKCVTGFTPTGGIPDLTGGGAWIQLENGHSPDVSIFRNNSANQADIVYINAQARIAVDLYRLDDLKNGIINLTNGFRSPLADLTYRYPRIATPNSLFGDPVDFTVVAEDHDNASTWYIKGFNSNACCNPQLTYAIYNDGTTSNSPYNLTDLPNLRPVASYDKNYNNIWIGWTFDNTSGMLMAPGAAWVKSPVVVIGDKHAALLPAQNYRYVPNGLLFGEQYNALSISGKNSTAMYFTYQKTGANTIFTKSANQNPVPVGLRTPANAPVITWLQEQAGNSENSSGNFHCVLFTTEGKIAHTLFGSIDSILDDMMMISEQTTTTFYLAEISNEKGIVLNSGKLILGIR